MKIVNMKDLYINMKLKGIKWDNSEGEKYTKNKKLAYSWTRNKKYLTYIMTKTINMRWRPFFRWKTENLQLWCKYNKVDKFIGRSSSSQTGAKIKVSEECEPVWESEGRALCEVQGAQPLIRDQGVR